MSEEINERSLPKQTNQSKKQLVNLIATQLYKYVNASNYDVKSLVMLVAALTMLNSGDNHQAINTARRLAMSAMTRSRTKKD